MKKILVLRQQSGNRFLLSHCSNVNLFGNDCRVIIFKDVTEEIKREKIEKLIVDNIRDVVALVDFNGKIRYISPSSKFVLGYNSEELIGKSIFEKVHPEDVNLVKRIFQEIIKGGDVGKVVCRFKEKSGKWIWIEAIGKVISYEDKIGVVSARDVTEMVTLENLLRVINNIGKLIVYTKNKEELLNNICHELASVFSSVGIWLIDNGAYKKYGTIEMCSFNGVIREKVTIEKCDACGKTKAIFPMIIDSKIKGVLVILLESYQEFEKERIEMLEVLAKDIAFALKTLELDEAKREAYRQIEDNIYKFAILVDEIKNPLTAILGVAEDIKDEKIKRVIVEQVERIRDIVHKLDEGWIESERVREFLKKYL